MKTCSCKTTRIALLLGSAGLVLGATSLLAGDASDGGLYFGTDAGVNLADDLSVSGVGSVSLSPGVRGDLTTGYAIKLSDQLSIAPELEVGFIYNSFDKATAGGVSAPASGDFFQMPLLANAVLDWHISSDFVAYAGGGAGFDYLVSSSYGNIGSETDFAWQGEAGLKYKLGSGELGLGYKYLACKPSGMGTVGNSAILLSYTFHF
jgi:opacity protein-like surface antigen